MNKKEHRLLVAQNIKNQIQQLEVRLGRKVTGYEIANSIGVTGDYIYKIVRGQRTGSHSLLISLAKYFNCSIDDLVMPRS